MEKIYEGTTNLEIVIDLGQDISSAIIHQVIVLKDGAEETWDAEIQDSNYLRFVYTKILEEGTYYLHPSLTIGDWSGLAKPVSFKVYPKWG